MANRRTNSIFVLVNVVISLAVALGAITLYTTYFQEAEAPRARPTIVLVVTATPNPNQALSADELQATVDSQAGTLVAMEREATQIANQPAPAVASDTDDDTSETASGNIPAQPDLPSSSGSDNLPTIDPNLIPALPQQGGGASGSDSPNSDEPLPEDGCDRYFVQAGDTASTIATRYNVQLSELFVLNGISDQTVLQIGDELLIPSDTCEPEIPATVTPTPQPTFDLNVVTPTSPFQAVTPTDSQIEIVNVAGVGDITAEQVEIQNLGGQLNLLGWQLSDEQGNVYTFPDVRLVQGSILRIATRSGTNTPGFLYWNQNQAVWTLNERVTLSDAAGNVQAIFTVGETP